MTTPAGEPISGPISGPIPGSGPGSRPGPGSGTTAPAGEPAVWWGWGAEDAHHPLPDAVRDLLGQLGIPARPSLPVALGDVVVPPGRLPPAAAAELTAAVGADHVRDDHEARVRHCRGRSTVDLLRLRAGDASDAPDAVVSPAGHDEVLAVLGICSRHRIAVVPFGGGTSVVGGLTPRPEGGDARHAPGGAAVPAAGDARHRPAGTAGGRTSPGWRAVIALDLHRLDRLLRVDPVSGTAVLGAGLRGPVAEALLAEHGLTLGHVPQSWEYATIGGFAATRSSGQASAGYGRFDQVVTALRLATPVGTWEPGRAPASAAGPDLRQLALGSEGAFGVITEVTARVRPLPARRRFEGWRVADLTIGLELLRALAQRNLLPTVCRLSDELETAAGLANAATAGTDTTAVAAALPEPPPADSAIGNPAPGDPAPGNPAPGNPAPGNPAPGDLAIGNPAPGDLAPPLVEPGGCYLVAGYEGEADAVARRADAVASVLTAGGAAWLGEAVGREWVRGRFHAPYLRDALLDEGIFAETLETAAYWTALPGLYAAVRAAVTEAIESDGSPVVVLCHISHVYPAGASLYFTIVCAQGPDPIARWSRAKRAAGDAIMANGGTITHHHAVGTDHLPWLPAEIGDVGAAVLRAVKAALDPAGVLNPGILIPAGDE